VSENLLRILQDHHVPKQPLQHLREFRERLDIIMNARLKSTYMNEMKKWEEGELEKAKEMIRNEIKEILSIEFMHALGGPELLGVVWNQFNPCKSLADANSMEIALFLQSIMNQREQMIFVPPVKANKVNVLSRTP